MRRVSGHHALLVLNPVHGYFELSPGLGAFHTRHALQWRLQSCLVYLIRWPRQSPELVTKQPNRWTTTLKTIKNQSSTDGLSPRSRLRHVHTCFEIISWAFPDKRDFGNEKGTGPRSNSLSQEGTPVRSPQNATFRPSFLMELVDALHDSDWII